MVLVEVGTVVCSQDRFSESKIGAIIAKANLFLDSIKEAKNAASKAVS
jgi:hypothetical protein